MGGLSPKRDDLLREDVRHIERIFGPELTRVGGARRRMFQWRVGGGVEWHVVLLQVHSSK